MSFSLGLKQEILNNKPMRVRCKRAQGYGLFLFGRSFSAEAVALHTENAETAQLFRWFARDILGKRTGFREKQLRRNGKIVQIVELADKQDRLRLLAHYAQQEGINQENLPLSEDIGAFLAGAYLACGSVTDPEKSYHLEFAVRQEPNCHDLLALLTETLPGARLTRRRQNHVVYYKECSAIQDLMTMMGAPKSSLALIEIELYKSIRNQANRATNCETANIDKLVGASTAQVEDIRLIFATIGEDRLNESLRSIAKLRLAYPESSLRELAELSPDPLSRSGVHHRLSKLSKIAAELRETGKGTGHV